MSGTNGHTSGSAVTGDDQFLVKKGLAEMLKGGVIMGKSVFPCVDLLVQ